MKNDSSKLQPDTFSDLFVFIVFLFEMCSHYENLINFRHLLCVKKVILTLSKKSFFFRIFQ
jgi:hypothetical protein